MAERTARLVIDRAAVTDAIDRRLFGSFIEHLGRAVSISPATRKQTAADTGRM